jgi:hypothetical protein
VDISDDGHLVGVTTLAFRHDHNFKATVRPRLTCRAL